MSAPWMKFYPRDWRGDQALRAVSIAARGFWIECLCIMHEAKPYGHLVLNGEKVEDDVLARMTGTSVDEVSALLAELRKAGVLSVTGKGVVFSRRMTKDFSKAQKGQKAVNKRWSQDVENTQQSDRPNRSNQKDLIPRSQIPDTREEKKSLESDFSEWYANYPRHVGRGQAEKAYGNARKTTEKQILLEAAQRFAEQSRGQDQKFIPHPATWLNGQRWLDGQGDAAPVGDSGGRDPATFTFEDWIARVEVALAGGPWPDSYGNHPKDAKTQNPQSLARWYFKQFHPDQNAKAVA